MRIAFASLLFFVPVHAQKPHPHATSERAPASQLPITRVALYKNGVGFFEHSGRVTGDQAVTIDFTSAQLNDVLQSLTAIDLNGGRIAGAGYNSTTPLDQQLRSLPLNLAAESTDVDFYNAIRGSRVQVTGAGGTIAGRLLSVDLRTAPQKEGAPTVERRFLTVVADAGQVKTLEVTPATTVTLLDGELRGDVTRYLEVLASNRSQGLRHLTLLDRGTGTRDLLVSYISEVPVWKSTYRILFTDAKQSTAPSATLQGWSVVDNTTGSDWVNVHLDLIAGAPQSFIQPLSTPYYARRPEIPLPQEAQLAPQTHESGDANVAGTSMLQGSVRDATGAVIPGSLVDVFNASGVQAASTRTDGQGAFNIAVQSQGPYRVQVSSPGFSLTTLTNVRPGVTLDVVLNLGSANQTVEVSADKIELAAPAAQGRAKLFNNYRGFGVTGGVAGINAPPPPDYAQSAQASIEPKTTTAAFDDFFQYSLSDPITIRKNESALVPILQTKLPIERVTLWSPQQPQALRALWVTNASTLTLDRGSFSIVENGSFGGEGLLDAIHPRERRLLSYAADQAVRVTPARTNNSRRVNRVTIHQGVLNETSTDVTEVTYDVRNAAPEARTVVIEHPVRAGYTLHSTPRPTESTPTVDRFEVIAPSGETVHLHVGERRTNEQLIRLVDRSEDQLTLLLRDARVSPAGLAALEPVFEAHHKVVAIDAQISARREEIASLTTDQNRLRENLKALKGTPEEKALATRYTGELNAQEDRLAVLNKEIAQLLQDRASADQDFQNRMNVVNFDETL